MKIIWNKVTWYSKFLAVIVIIGTFFIAFYLGAQYREIQNMPSVSQDVVSSGNNIVLKIGEIGRVGDFRIKINSLVNDYRCAVDTPCPESGSVVLNVTFESGSQKKTMNFPSDQAPYTYLGHKISIVAFTSLYKIIKPNAEPFHVTFHIEN